MANGHEDWRTQAFRSKVITQIEDVLRQSATPMNKSSHEMENHVYQKAASREQYLALVARLILHVRDFNKEKKAGLAAPGMIPGGALGGMPPGQNQPLQDPMNALQNLAMQGATGMPGPPQPGMMSAQQQRMTLQAQRQQQQQQHQQQLLQQQMLQAGGRGAAAVAAAKKFPLQRQDAFLVTSPPQLQPIQSLPLAASAAGMQQRPVQAGPLPGQQQNFQQGTVPPQSTIPSTSPAHGHGSPMTTLAAPSPQGTTNPSPAVKGPVTGAPSPSGILNTPGNPQIVQSPSGNISSEEQAYLEKLNQLSKYIEPLRRMIIKLERDEEHKKDYGQIDKMKNLLEILSDSSKRMSMATLLKCEQVLEKIDIPGTAGKSASSSLASASSTHMCQPLINAVAENIKNPGINHALQRTFGPAVSALWGSQIRAPVLPKKRKREEEKGSEVPDLLQGEIARLDHRFRVHLDPKYHKQSPSVHLVCNINDKRLPNVPPILVTVPEDYPLISPKCNSSLSDYESTPFLKSVHCSLETSLSKMPNRFSVTTLLDTWEMSIRKACASVIAVK